MKDNAIWINVTELMKKGIKGVGDYIGQLYAHEELREKLNDYIGHLTAVAGIQEIDISDQRPEDYFKEVEAKQPGALALQWIPMDSDLWKVGRYRDFLDARRELLAQTTNRFLDSLRSGSAPLSPVVALPEQPIVVLPGGVQSEEEHRMILEVRQWLVEQGLSAGEHLHELVDPATGEQTAVLDLAWPKGLQEEFSQPVALLLDENLETEDVAWRAGFYPFMNVQAFRAYVEREILVVKE